MIFIHAFRGRSATSLFFAEIKKRATHVTLFSLFFSLFVFIPFNTQSAAAAYAPSNGITFSNNGYIEMSAGFPVSADITVEGWVRSTNWSTENAVVLLGSGNSGAAMTIRSVSNNQWSVDQRGVARVNFSLPGTQTMSNNSWLFIAVVKDANGISMWVNGNPLTYVNGSCGGWCTVTSGIPKMTTAWSSNSYQFGAWRQNGWYTQGGTIGEVRLSNLARVASNASTYSVPTSTLSEDGNTVLLLKAPSSGSSFTDSRTNPQTLTTGGTVTASAFLQSQTITFSTSSYALAYGSTQQLSVTGTSGTGAVTYSAGSSTACSVNSSSGVVSITASSGTCSITATIAADSAYNSDTTATPVTITVSKAASTIVATGSTTFTFTGSAQGPSNATVTPAGSTGTVTYSYSGSGTTSFGPGPTKPTNAGTYTVTASVAASTNYNSASSATYAFTIAPAAQGTPLVISSTVGTLGTNLTLQTTGGNSGGSNSFNVDSGSCTVSGSTLSATAAGTCMVTATKAADLNYLAVSSSSTAITINKATPTFSNFSDLSKIYGTSAFNLTPPTSSTAGTWSYSSGTTSVITINGVSATVVGAGTSLITATFTPNNTADYVSGGTFAMTVTVGKATQTVILSATSSDFNLGQSDTLTATVAAGASGTAIFSAGGNALCTTGVLNSVGAAQCAWTPTVAGTYSVTAAYSGDSNYSATTSSSTLIVVNSVITYDANGGTGSAPTAWTSPGTSTTLPSGTALSKSGYTFGGWSTTSSGAAVSSTYSSTISRTLYAVWTANSYTITYNANGGSGSQTSGSYTTGASATALSGTTTFTRTGYTFGGWASSATSTTAVTSYSTSAAVSFYAIWIHGTYTVTYAANGGAGTMAAQTSNATANLSTNSFTYTDRVFNGWNTSADGTGTPYSNSVTYPFLASITLHAQWGNVITYTRDGATSGSPSRASESWSSGAINLPTVGTMVRTGYTFGGWNNGTTTYAAGSSYTPTGGITFNPVWSANTYSITFNKNLATSGSVPTSQSWTAGTTARALSGNIGSPVLAKSGYTFGGWATSASSTTAITTHSTASNQTFYAIWTPVSYTIAYALNGGTSTLPTQANQQIYNTFTLAATPTKADYYFAGWSDSATATTYAALATYSITATSAPTITLTAQWIPTYTLNYVLNGSTSAVTGEGTYTSGTIVTLSATPVRTGYTFNNWLDSSNVTHAAGSSFTVLQNSVLQAQWTAILYPVTYALNGATGTLPLQSSLAINSPFTVSTAPVRAGYTFGGWSDGTNTYPTGSTYVIGTSSVTLTAQWSAIPYSVTYDLGGGQATLPTQADGLIGSTFTLPASSANPTWIAHTFTGWSDGSAVYAAGSTYTFKASNVTLTAQFSLNGYTQVTYSLGINGAGELPNPTSALEGNTITVASGAGVTRANYAFAGWSDGQNLYQPGNIYLVGPESAPITFVPNWTSGYNVTYSTGNGFGVAPIDTVGRITGATFSVASASTLSRQGFTFTGWSDGTNVVQPGATYTIGSTNITLTAQWVQNSLAGISSSALTPLASFSIVNGVGPSGSFNFGSTTISYVIPVNSLSPGTTVSIYGLSDTSSISGVLPSGKTVVSSTVISWLSTDGTVPDASSPIAMTITNSEIVPGTVVYAITGSSIVILGTATSYGSITTNITIDPVIVLANPYVAPVIPPTPVVVPPSSGGGGGGGGGGGSTYVAPIPTPTPTVDPAVAAAAAAKALADAKAAEEKAIADAKALAEKRAAEEAALLATIKALQDKADADALAAAKKLQDELAAEQLKAEEELKVAAALKLVEEQRIAAERAAAAKKITTVYSLTSAFKLNTTYTKRLNTYTKKIATGSTVTCIGYAKGSKTLSYAKAKVVASKQANALCSSMKKINPTLKTKSIVYPASKAPVTTVNKKWIPVSYRIESPVN